MSNLLKDKNILLGVCGSISSYKSAELIRLLVKAGANVKVVMTIDAKAFITPLTLATLSKNPVEVDYFDPHTGEWNNHVEFGLWADFMLIAPATANTLSKCAQGICDNLLLGVYLSAKCPVYFAPAMDLDMWKHPSTQNNINILKSFGNQIIKPAHGELASGLVGEGRLAEPQDIVEFLNNEISKALPLAGKKVVVTAGPTYEAIDPVRFLGNHSSGKMGYAIAEEMAKQGADVVLISGPTSLRLDRTAKLINVTSAQEMYDACLQEFTNADIFVMSAAVADYTPKSPSTKKIKKNTPDFTIELEKTKDILLALGEQKKSTQILVGFALETHQEEEFAKLKLEKKNLDFIVLNSMNDEGAGFKNDTNKITIIDKNLSKTTFDLKSKSEVAIDICEKIQSLL